MRFTSNLLLATGSVRVDSRRAVSFGAPRQASSGSKGADSGLFLGVR